MNVFVVCLGSNVEERQQLMQWGVGQVQALCQDPTQWLCSDIYLSEPWHSAPGKPLYLNAVVSGVTDMGYDQLNAQFKALEHTAGRTPQRSAQGLINLDIDIVVWNGTVVRAADFSAPFFKRGYAEIITQTPQLAHHDKMSQ